MGAERFRRVFEKTVKACISAKIATGEIVHIDASLIRADVSWESLAVRHVEAVAKANELDTDDAEKESRETGKYKKVCITDPDARMATSARNRRLEPAYKQWRSYGKRAAANPLRPGRGARRSPRQQRSWPAG